MASFSIKVFTNLEKYIIIYIRGGVNYERK